jgi:hypothetical protein
MFQKKYVIVILLDNEKDAMLIASKEGYGDVNRQLNGVYPLTVTIPKRMTLLQSIRKQQKYNKMGMFTMIVEQK